MRWAGGGSPCARPTGCHGAACASIPRLATGALGRHLCPGVPRRPHAAYRLDRAKTMGHLKALRPPDGRAQRCEGQDSGTRVRDAPRSRAGRRAGPGPLQLRLQ